MKKGFLGILLVLSVLIMVPVMAQSGADTYHFKDNYASASFSSYDSCITTWTDIGAGENIYKYVPGRPNGTSSGWLYINQYNLCTEETVMASYGWFDLQEGEFSVGTNSARLVKNVTVHDSVSGSDINLSIDLTWTGIGSMWFGNNHYHSPTMKTHSNGSYREANVSGIISDGINNYASGTYVYGSLSRSNSGSVYHY